MAAQDAAQMDVATDVCLFELVHHLAYMAALQKAAGLTPMQLEPSISKQIGGFAKARACEARHCCRAAQRPSMQRASMASKANGGGGCKVPFELEW
jgi:hypothetical protein